VYKHWLSFGAVRRKIEQAVDRANRRAYVLSSNTVYTQLKKKDKKDKRGEVVDSTEYADSSDETPWVHTKYTMYKHLTVSQEKEGSEKTNLIIVCTEFLLCFYC
jgi:hypothetical protein